MNLEVREFAQRLEGGNDEEKLFQLLVVVAREYEQEIAKGGPPWSLDPKMTPRDVMLRGLKELLDLDEEQGK